MTRKRLVNSAVFALAPILLVLGGGLFDAAHATGQQTSCDFITGGGQIPGSPHRNFGAAGGVKKGAFWGHLQYQDKSIDLKVQDLTITAYYATDRATRVIEGRARTNKYGDRNFRVTASDYGKRDNEDYFKIEIIGVYVAQGWVRKGEIQLHSKNRDCTPPPDYTCQEPEQDTESPTVSITAPVCGSTVRGIVPVKANATDNVGVTMVEFFVNGVSIGVDTTDPYEVSWNSASAPEDQPATLTAKAHDAAGNITTSTACNVTVDNQAPPDTTPPNNVAIVSPTCGSVTPVSGMVTVEATASDNVGVARVDFFVDGILIGTDFTADVSTGRFSVDWSTTTVTDGPHTLTAVARDAANNSTSSPNCSVNVLNAPPPLITTVFVSLVNGDVHEYTSEGLLLRIYPGASNGQASTLAFDAAGNMYVPHWIDPINPLLPGNTIERFNVAGLPMGTFGTGYNCNPSSVDFDAAGNVYVGQADCSGDILKFSPTGTLLASYNVTVQARGSDHIELAADNCTMFYSSRGADILRYNVCTNTQLANFNTAPLPDAPFHIELLPDGGLLVANGTAGITRLDASGNFVRSYFTPVPPGSGGNLWGGVDLAPDGTSFWASNGFNGDIVRFDLATGNVLNFFNTGTGNFTAAGVEVRP